LVFGHEHSYTTIVLAVAVILGKPALEFLVEIRTVAIVDLVLTVRGIRIPATFENLSPGISSEIPQAKDKWIREDD
jgi:hypothetical protein